MSLNATPRGRIVLVRHGETEANRSHIFAPSDHIPLTPHGLTQAAAAAASIESICQPAHVFSSEFLRARQTAEVIAQRLGLPVETLSGIHERNFGVLLGRPYRDMADLMRQDPGFDPLRRWLWAPEGAESLEQVRSRAVEALANLCAAHPGRDLVVVSHGAVMECISAHLSGDWDQAQVPPNCGLAVIPFERLLTAVV